MLPPPLRQEIERHTGSIQRMTRVGGGSIAEAFRLEAKGGSFFLKQASGGAGASFEAEAEGLGALGVAAEGSGLCVPQVLYVRSHDVPPGLLLLPWIEGGRADASYWHRLGEGLAALHRNGPEGSCFGFASDNFIGATPQKNGWMGDWVEFFRSRRLEPQIDFARRGGRWSSGWVAPARRLLERLGEWLPRNPTRSLVHGDLWGGNHLPGADGCPWLIDPAPYVGCREVDLAMTELFGGFDAAFYAAYDSVWARESGYPERREIYNLYHLLNHLNLFGSSYGSSVERTLLRFGRV